MIFNNSLECKRPGRMSPKIQLFTAFAAVARALGNPHRLDLLEHLAQGEKPVEALALKADLSFANASQHLQALKRVGLVEAERRGKKIVYRLASDDVHDLLAALRQVAERHTDQAQAVIEDYFHARDRLEEVSFVELERKLSDGLVTLLDVRPPDEFADGHLPGALNVPLADLSDALAALPSDREIVAYCRGPWCVLAFQAVSLLRTRGRLARRLDGGLPEWRRAGRTVVTASIRQAE